MAGSTLNPNPDWMQDEGSEGSEDQDQDQEGLQRGESRVLLRPKKAREILKF